MPLYLNNQTSEPSKVWMGGNAVSRIYRGSTQIWPKTWPMLRPMKARDGLGGAMIRESDGTMWVAGNNGNGCLGLGHENDVSRFTLVPDPGPWKEAYIGYWQSWAIKTDGSLWFAGNASYGNSLPGGDYTNWTRVSEPVNVVNTANGFTNGRVTFFVLSSGDLWGGGQMVSLAPELPSVAGIVNVSSVINNVQQVDGSLENTIVLKKNGTVWTSGRNANGMCGNGSTGSTSFQQVMTGAKRVVACYYFFTVLKADGTIWWCGDCPDGANRTTFTQAPISGVSSIHGNHGAVFAIKSNGELWNIGYNSYGEFGIGTSGEHHTSFVRTPDLLVEDIGGGYSINYIRTTDGRIMSAGRNAWGQRAGGGGTSYKEVTHVW